MLAMIAIANAGPEIRSTSLSRKRRPPRAAKAYSIRRSSRSLAVIARASGRSGGHDRFESFLDAAPSQGMTRIERCDSDF
ncbi:hypothetical protein [Pseudorhodoplanes sp.]|uniref:hypothetical protein n=1 Tax=Pseudorhodoplanes sp. TaxID=1934341 RepID=UPI002D7EF251|nr:hypothetical protein [Pseudorhodoplanes sp.]